MVSLLYLILPPTLSIGSSHGELAKNIVDIVHLKSRPPTSSEIAKQVTSTLKNAIRHWIEFT